MLPGRSLKSLLLRKLKKKKQQPLEFLKLLIFKEEGRLHFNYGQRRLAFCEALLNIFYSFSGALLLPSIVTSFDGIYILLSLIIMLSLLIIFFIFALFDECSV